MGGSTEKDRQEAGRGVGDEMRDYRATEMFGLGHHETLKVCIDHEHITLSHSSANLSPPD